jgi:hypothetical protein
MMRHAAVCIVLVFLWSAVDDVMMFEKAAAD